MRKRYHIKKPKNQVGATLLVGLIILLLMTFIGLAAIRGSGMQELMAGNMRDRQLAFQAAEAALRLAEAELSDVSGKTISFADEPESGSGYFQEMSGSSAIEFWLEFDWENDSISPDIDDMNLSGVASQPRYVVERIEGSVWSGNDGGPIDHTNQANAEPPEYYRITSRGVGSSDSTIVILQSTAP
ncbi:PilX N-terminal domain-containing pilus assembly protein [Microbulbifer sp. TRSA002]|uniref:pilus assembly PilX family protein n=1 Tax=Microbulbifer sp. TRSA002 TaxID=3243382 RepID=UPI00403A4115